MALLEIRDLFKTFGGHTAVNRVSLTLHEGESFGLIGPNGAGKTTLLNCIAGTYKPSGGTVRLLGEDTTGLPADRLCKKGLARTFQTPRPFPKLTALENVMVAATFGSPPGAIQNPAQWADQLLDYVEFPRPKDTRADSLNTGQLKRLDLARTLASQPRLVLLDEIAAGLTPGELDDFLKILHRIKESGITLFVVEHVMRVILGLCDRLAVIHYGEKIAEGIPTEVASDPKVLEAYFGESGVR